MRLEKIPLGETGNNFSPVFLDYLEANPSLSPFYNEAPHLENFGSRIRSRKFPDAARNTLYEALSEQYRGINPSPQLSRHLALLKEKNTFTVTTGHQLNIFSGPLYFIYKIVTVINCCKKLKAQYPGYHFVPVYWMASEDHDFEEINHFTLFGKVHTWKTEQKGAVGRFSPKSIARILEEMPEKPELFEKAYLKHDTLADATRYFVNELFGEYGLVVVDGDNKRLKSAFAGIIKEDILHQTSNPLVEKTSGLLSEMGYKTPVHPREINFFYLKEGLRERIIKEGDLFKIHNTGITFSATEIVREVEEHPERFSPNVVLRPVYQEKILPNLAYIGGPAEVAYWLQFKAVFDHFQIPFPIVMPRNFALIINKTVARKFHKLGISLSDIFMDRQALKNKFIAAHAENGITLEKEKEAIAAVFDGMKKKAGKIDKSLTGFIGSEESKSLKSVDNIARRLKKSEEQKHQTALQQLENMKEKLFPGGRLQERTENFLNFYINEPGLISFLVDRLDPFDYRFNVIFEDEESST